MTDLSNEFFEATLSAVKEQLEDLITTPKSERAPPDKFAKDLSALLKAQAETQAQYEAFRAKTEAKKYTRYEDMPPPTPEDEARFDAEFQQILADLFDEDDEEDKAGDQG